MFIQLAIDLDILQQGVNNGEKIKRGKTNLIPFRFRYRLQQIKCRLLALVQQHITNGKTAS